MVPDQVVRIIAQKRLFGYSEARLGRFHAS